MKAVLWAAAASTNNRMQPAADTKRVKPLTCKLWPAHSRHSSKEAVHVQMHHHTLRGSSALLLLLLPTEEA
jgi:hypothetical protein